jgi:RHH-type transcriptional regulator, proline utilization regulon repressor / proline dehydrogenase / delta 1-pyrroline-5-carboxylate dehydrogenase
MGKKTMQDSFEEAVINEGQEIFNTMKTCQESFFHKEAWLGRIMDWVMKDQSFKIDLFRLVDVLPMLSTEDQVAKHIKEYLLDNKQNLPFFLSTALKASSFGLSKGLASSMIKKNVSDMAKRFIAGKDINHAKEPLVKLHQQGFSCTIDLLGEKTLSEQEADVYFERYKQLISVLPKLLGGVNDFNVSVKVSALSCHLVAEDPKYSVSDIKNRILPLLRLAKQNNVFINFDVENFQTHEIVFLLFQEIALSDEFRAWPHLGIVVQAYLKNSLEHVQSLIKLCENRNTPITIRLVKGAYWDYEVVKAEQLGQAVKVFLHKEQTDQNYEHLSKMLLDHIHLLCPAFGSHNIRSLAHAIAYAKQKNIEKDKYEIQMLYGMAEPERKSLLERGHQVRIYVPLGEMLPGMSYLVRRLLENTSQMSFLKLSHHDKKNERCLLQMPRFTKDKHEEKNKAEFINAEYLDFTNKSIREKFSKAILVAKNSLPMKIQITIEGKNYSSENIMSRPCPSDTDLVVSQCHFAEIKHVDLAVESCVNGFLKLQSLPLIERAGHLKKLSQIIEQDRYELAAMACLEVGKTWAEADADVAEAIDFCRYYADRALIEIACKKMGDVAGERNILLYQGRGPTAVIAPWNFPFAILCGMSVAAYVAGNPIIMKPAEQSMVTAHMLFERMIKASFLKEAINFLPGEGEVIGPYLVSHKNIANICFTGSMKVGHQIIKSANTVVSGQVQMKRVICEMGGKNAIIIDDDADLDEAITSVINSAFIYAGQKCSAASRVITVGTINNLFVERLISSVNSLKMGNTIEPSTFLGPVIDKHAFLRLGKIKEKLLNDKSITILFEGNKIEGGYFISPIIVLVKDVDHWVMQEELFGPILALYHASDLEQAIKVANHTQYALTGAIFSRSPKNIDYARQNFNVGNLYINQKCTGAIVNRQPFGGFKMSGSGLKAGGPNYLLNLVDAKVVSENTMRRGFTPEVSI